MYAHYSALVMVKIYNGEMEPVSKLAFCSTGISRDRHFKIVRNHVQIVDRV